MGKDPGSRKRECHGKKGEDTAKKGARVPFAPWTPLGPTLDPPWTRQWFYDDIGLIILL